MNNINTLVLGYDLDMWEQYGAKIPVITDCSPSTNTHCIVAGMSGGGKSVYLNYLFSNIIATTNSAYSENPSEFHFADYKGDDKFSHLRDCPKYYSYKNTLDALDIVYTRFNERLSGADETRHTVTLIWDEYMANMLDLINADKKQATEVMNRVSVLLQMGRSMAVRISIFCQRPDSLAFPAGSRLNMGISVILGAAVNSIYEMLMPDFVKQIEGRKFSVGEGVCLLQGSDLRFIKYIYDEHEIPKIHQACKNALS
jgi:hypothetical protein